MWISSVAMNHFIANHDMTMSLLQLRVDPSLLNSYLSSKFKQILNPTPWHLSVSMEDLLEIFGERTRNLIFIMFR